jgi:voltage-gated sodium channel
VLLLIAGGIIGMSLINSIFVDAMVSDNNDELEKKIDRLEKKIDQLLKEKENDNADQDFVN